MGSPAFSADYRTMYFTMNKSDKEQAPEKQFSRYNISPSGKTRPGHLFRQVEGRQMGRDTAPTLRHHRLQRHTPWHHARRAVPVFCVQPSRRIRRLRPVLRKKRRQGKWSSPMNLGGKINTAYDEMNPFALSDSLLYFSTEGRVELWRCRYLLRQRQRGQVCRAR